MSIRRSPMRLRRFQSLISGFLIGLSVLLVAIATPGCGSGPAESQAVDPSELPSVAIVTGLTPGDLMCYADVTDDEGKTYTLGATFEICAEEALFIGQRVRLSYEDVSVNDCESAEPCGKSRLETLIMGMQVIGESVAQGSPDASDPATVDDESAPSIATIGETESSRSYRLTLERATDIVYVQCPDNYEPTLELLSSDYAIQCKPL